ncbi:MAG: nitroreductase family protein [Tepidiformaceae bacterium]
MRDRIIANAQRAPSAGFSQGWAFLAIEDEERLARFWEVSVEQDARAGSASHGLRNAALVVVPLSHKRAYLDRYSEPDKQWTGMADETRWPAPYWDIDTGMASLLVLQTAVDAGLGALFFGILRGRFEAFRKEFGVPEDYHPIGAVAIGYIADDAKGPSVARGRKPPTEVVHYNHW